MAKKINIVVNNCGECPHTICYKGVEICSHIDNIRIIKNIDIFHPDCPLEDVEENSEIKLPTAEEILSTIKKITDTYNPK
jgi:hypothetical protein